MEKWKRIKDCDGYWISSRGRVYSEKTGAKLKPHLQENGYLLYTLRNNTKPVYKYCHRLVAENFIPNPKELPQVHHIDNDPLNNVVDNLMWVTAKENCNYKSETVRRKYAKNAIKQHGIPLVEKLNGEVSISFVSMNQVPKMHVSTLQYHISRGHTHFTCKGRTFICPKNMI